MGCSKAGQITIANLLNYQLDSFPMTYFGIPIADRKLLANDFILVVQKVGKRVQTWHGKFNTSEGKVILVKSCLSSIHMFLMGFHLVLHVPMRVLANTLVLFLKHY